MQYTSENNIPSSSTPSQYKAGFIALVGRPSVGKSTLMNCICNERIAITSKFPQTTRNIIRGIKTTNEYQCIFMDTPGIHLSQSKFGTHLTQHALTALEDADSILYLVDAHRAPQDEERAIIAILKKAVKPLCVCMNKMDIENPKIVQEYLQLFRKELGEKIHACHFISCVDNVNIQYLIKDLAHTLPVHPPYYPDNYYTDQNPEYRICEEVRSVVLTYVYEELPYYLYTEILEFQIKHRDEYGNPLHVFVRVNIVVDSEGHRAIIIGTRGTVIKKIRQEASTHINALFDYHVQLEIRVVVKKKWRQNPALLSRL